MAITTAMCTSFKAELLSGTHDFTTDNIKVALIKVSPSGTYGAATTNYSDVTGNSDEATGTNYTVGGQTLDTPSITTSGTTAFVDFADETFSDITIATTGCIIYNASKSNKSICVIDFGGTISSVAGNLTLEIPTADASNAIVRIA